jgi:hypothetical protein
VARVLAEIAARRNLNPPRRHRSYPRVVKRARYNSYRVKSPTATGTRHPGQPVITMVSTARDGTLINLS